MEGKSRRRGWQARPQLVARWEGELSIARLQLPPQISGEADVQGKAGAPLKIEALL